MRWGYLLLIFPQKILQSLYQFSLSVHNEEISALIKVPQFLLGNFLLTDEVSTFPSESIQKSFLYRSLIFTLGGKSLHSKRLSFLCIRIPMGEWVEDKITRMQSSSGPKWSCSFFYTEVNYFSASADNFLDYLSPYHNVRFEINYFVLQL